MQEFEVINMEVPYSEQRFEKPTKNSNGDFDFGLVDLKLARHYTQGSTIIPVRNITPVGASAPETKITDGTTIMGFETDGTLKGISLTGATNATVANNNTQTIFTAGASGARIRTISLNAVCQTVAATATAEIQVNGVTVLKQIFTPTTTGQNVSINLGTNYLPLSNGQSVTVISSTTQVWAYGSITYN